MAYLDKIKRDIAHWVDAGLIGSDVGRALALDVEQRHGSGVGFGQVLAVMAALLLGAAILILVAANWEAIPRLWRVAALFAIIAGGYVGGAWLKLRDHAALAEAAWLVAAAAFGASIALISQMYHLTGDEAQAILVWCLGVAMAAVGLRSAILAAASVGLAIAWVLYPVLDFGFDVNPWFPVLLAALWAVATWTRSVPARHMILLALIIHVVVLYLEDDLIVFPIGLALVSAAVLAATVVFGEQVERLTGLGAGLAVDALAGFLTGMFLLQLIFVDEAHFIWLAALTIAGIAAALVYAGRTGRGLRWLAYLGFAIEIGFVYVATVGTMLGTAGFFLLAAIALGLLAFVIIRVERKMKAPATASGDAR